MDSILAMRSPAERNIAPIDLVAEANHRIANSLTVLVSMVRMQPAAVKKNADSYSNAEVRHLLHGIAARINTISQLHRIISHAGADGVISLSRICTMSPMRWWRRCLAPNRWSLSCIPAGTAWCRCARCSPSC